MHYVKAQNNQHNRQSSILNKIIGGTSSFAKNILGKKPALIVLFGVLFSFKPYAGEIYAGASTADITPKIPVALMGQFYLRLAEKVETPLLANVVAIESREGSNSDYAIFVACDLIVISPPVYEQARAAIAKRLPGIDVNKVILTATHTHTSPVLDTVILKYPIPEQGVTQIQEYLDFFSGRVAEAVAKAWEARKPASVTWGLSHAVVGYNRRSVYADGSAAMYGATEIPEFRGIEGPEDHDVNSLFFWNKAGKLVAIALSVPCPAQEVENRNTINADYWHEVRLDLKKRFGQDVVIAGWAGASGDQSPHIRYRLKGDERMHKLAGLSHTQEIGRRVGVAIQETYDVVKNDKHLDIPFAHKVQKLMLPMRQVTEAERLNAIKNRDRVAKEIEADPSTREQKEGEMNWYGATVVLAEKQKADPDLRFPAEVHVIRIGDIVICTSPFELFVDYSVQIQARSKATQTFVVQLAGAGNYLPTQKAKQGGGYSAIVQSTPVGPEGGMILVDRTVEMINSLWPDPNK